MDERRHIRVAADNPVEGDNIGGLDDVRERHEVADAVIDSIGMTLAFRLLTGGRDVGARGIHVHCRVGPSAQELVMHRPNAAADLEDRLPLDPAGRQGVDQGLGQTCRPVAAVFTQIVCSVAGVELAIV